MNIILRSLIRGGWHPGRAAVAGIVATAAYSLVMEGDMYLTGNRYSDIRFIEGLIGGKSRQSGRLSLVAWIIHFLNGAILGEVYALVFKRFLPGPNWLRGSLFGEMFVLSTWWLSPFVDKHHPLTKRG